MSSFCIFRQRLLISCWIFCKGFKFRDVTLPKAFKFQDLKPPKAFKFQDLEPLRCNRRLLIPIFKTTSTAIRPSPFRCFREAGSRTVPVLLKSLCRSPSNYRLQNHRPTLVVPPNVSTSVEVILICSLLLLETLLVKFLPAPEPFRRKYAFTINKIKHLRPCFC